MRRRLLVYALLLLGFFSSGFLFEKKQEVPVPIPVLSAIRDQYDPAGKNLSPSRSPLDLRFRAGDKEKMVTVDRKNPEVNLARYVSSKSESFRFSIEPQWEVGETTALYFINKYRPTKMGDKVWGLKCNEAVKIQDNVGKLLKSGGVELSYVNGHYLSVIGGDFVLLNEEGDVLHVHYFKLRDSRYRSRLCRASD